jgi:hypothetical protein
MCGLEQHLKAVRAFGTLALAACSASRAPIFRNGPSLPSSGRQVFSRTAAEFFEFIQTKVAVRPGTARPSVIAPQIEDDSDQENNHDAGHEDESGLARALSGVAMLLRIRQRGR